MDAVWRFVFYVSVNFAGVLWDYCLRIMLTVVVVYFNRLDYVSVITL